MTLDKYMTVNNVADAKFATLIGVSRQMVRQWRNGKCVPNVANVQKIYHATSGLVTLHDWEVVDEN